jgi:hypothetical protein
VHHGARTRLEVDDPDDRPVRIGRSHERTLRRITRLRRRHRSR